MLEVLLYAWAAVTMGSFGLVLVGLAAMEVLREVSARPERVEEGESDAR